MSSYNMFIPSERRQIEAVLIASATKIEYSKYSIYASAKQLSTRSADLINE